jgi:hypothetical protein
MYAQGVEIAAEQIHHPDAHRGPLSLAGWRIHVRVGEVVLRGGGGDVEAHQLPSTPRGRSPSAQR